MKNTALEQFVKLAGADNHKICRDCGEPGGMSMRLKCRECGGPMIDVTEETLAGQIDRAWLAGQLKCGACGYGVVHRLPFDCILGMTSAGKDCENGLRMLAEMHITENYQDGRDDVPRALSGVVE